MILIYSEFTVYSLINVFLRIFRSTAFRVSLSSFFLHTYLISLDSCIEDQFYMLIIYMRFKNKKANLNRTILNIFDIKKNLILKL
jgi:hypothetical protein